MPIPEVAKERIDQALKEFDDTLRDTPVWQGWEDRRSQKFAIEENGRRYPPKYIVSMATGEPVGKFYGGSPTNGYLTSRGFRIVTLRGRAIADLLEQILREYPQARTTQAFGSDAQMYRIVKRAEEELSGAEVLGDRRTLSVVASAGQGNWARVPWISFLDSRETDTTQRGVYVVILFRQDGSGLYLTFNQGVTEPTRRLGVADATNELRTRAESLRGTTWCRALNAQGFLLDNSIDLRADPGLGRNYEASTIAHKFYARGAVPNDEQLLKDLTALLTAYDSYVDERPRPKPMHLLLKWSASEAADTMEQHMSFATSHGHVWWGKFGQAIGPERYSQLKSQLERQTKTYVFFYGGNTVWQATLEKIANSSAGIEINLLPAYYRDRAGDYKLFVRVSDFKQRSRQWLLENAVSDPDGDNLTSRLDGRQAFAYLRLVNEDQSQNLAPLCVVGTAGDASEYFDYMTRSISEHGACASWWSFPITENARAMLEKPFFLYINAGDDEIGYRVRVDEYLTSEGNAGIESPWPDITAPEERGKTRASESLSEIFKTWFKCGAIDRLPSLLTSNDFRLEESLSRRLLNPNAFGYGYLKGGSTEAESTETKDASMDRLVDRTLLNRETLQEIVDSLRGGSPQIVLAGPPGTSKTWVAEAVAEYVANGSQNVRLVQFHPNYSYESFIEGLRPVAEGGAINFKLQHGALRSFVESMKAAGEVGSESPLYVLLLDEMNRANLPRVFGELMYLFEYRDKEIRLQYSENFALPPNLRFIGTMNTADRSIRSIDIALRRRFDVFELRPDSGVLQRYFEKHRLNVSNLIEGFDKLNKRLEENLDRHHTIGHAFFMKPGLDRRMLRAIWDRKIYPLIEEYFFDQLDIAKKEYVFEQFWPG